MIVNHKHSDEMATFLKHLRQKKFNKKTQKQKRRTIKRMREKEKDKKKNEQSHTKYLLCHFFKQTLMVQTYSSKR